MQRCILLGMVLLVERASRVPDRAGGLWSVACTGPRWCSISRALMLMLAAIPARAAAGQSVDAVGVISGIVRDSSGIAVSAAQIAITETSRYAASDAHGRFRLSNVAGGPAILRVQRIGFQTFTMQVVVVGGRTTEVAAVLTPVARELAPARVTASRKSGEYTGRFAEFNRRREAGFGYFITREQITQQDAAHFTDLLRRIPGIRIAAGFGQSRIRIRGAKCPPHVWIDGTPASPIEFNLDAILPQTVEGIEIYSGVASVPAELMAGRFRGQCGVVAVWTRLD